jgi:hypothetical protein
MRGRQCARVRAETFTHERASEILKDLHAAGLKAAIVSEQ